MTPKYNIIQIVVHVIPKCNICNTKAVYLFQLFSVYHTSVTLLLLLVSTFYFYAHISISVFSFVATAFCPFSPLCSLIVLLFISLFYFPFRMSNFTVIFLQYVRNYNTDNVYDDKYDIEGVYYSSNPVVNRLAVNWLKPVCLIFS